MSKRKLCLALIVFGLSAVVFSQEKRKLSEVSLADLEMKTYEGDSTANAVILHDAGVTQIALNGLEYIFERELRIKILKESGQKYADFMVPLYYKETIASVKAISYNLVDGKIKKAKLKKDNKFTDKVTKYGRLIKLSLPDVQVGTVIDIKYRVNSYHVFNLRPWYFQYEIPVVYSYYNLCYPGYFGYKKNIFGYHDLLFSKDSDVMSASEYGRSYTYFQHLYKFQADSVQAFKAETYIPCPDDYKSKVEFSLTVIDYGRYRGTENYAGTWDKVAEGLRKAEKFGWRFKNTDLVKKIAEYVKKKSTDPHAQVSIAYDIVKHKIKWEGYSSCYIRRPFAEIWEEKTGSSGEINMLFMAVIRELGVDALPVFISTSDNGKLYPFRVDESRLNDVLVYIKEGKLKGFYDLTEKNCPMGMLPQRCLNGQGMMMAKHGIQWIEVENEKKQEQQVVASFQFANDGTLKGGVLERGNAYEALKERDLYVELGSGEKYKEEFIEKYANWEVSKFSLTGVDDLSKPFDRKFELTNEDFWAPEDERVYFNPLLVGNLGGNPFVEVDRSVPVDFVVPISKLVKLNIQLPEGYVVEELPKAQKVSVADGAGSFLYNIQVVGNMMQLTQLFEIKKNLFLPNEYKQLKRFYAQVMEVSEQSVVLKRLTNENKLSLNDE